MDHDDPWPPFTSPAYTWWTGSMYIPASERYSAQPPNDPRLLPVPPKDDIDVLVNESLQRGQGRYW